MHKLAKGLKKKKKQKKGKKGEDAEEFEPEELERYRRERAEAQQKQLEATAEPPAAANDSSASGPDGGPKKPADNDEWKRFQALTSGIDTVLKKTQDDLDRIKSTSFYQRKEKEPEPDPEESPEVQARRQELAKKYAGFDEHGNPIELKDEQEPAEDKALPVTEDGFVEVPDDDDEHDDSADEDIFDTAYVDVIQNVDVQLAYIPDSPTEEELGDDPFDTSQADKVLKIVDTKTGRKLVSLGNAAEVLAGRVDHVSTCKIGRNRPRQAQDLLIGDFDAELPVVQVVDEDAAPVVIEKTLLDDDSDLPDVDLPPVDLTKLPPILSRPITPANPEDAALTGNSLDIVSEFELLKDKTILDEIPVLDEEEFDLEAPTDEPVVLEEPEDPFAETTSLQPQELEIVEVAFEVATFVNEEVDPFDTSYVSNIEPGQAELRVIESELLSKETEHAKSAPNQRELKFVKPELLEDDDDFDPRAEETPAKFPEPCIEEEEYEQQARSRGRKPSRPEALEIAPKVVAFELPAPSGADLLVAGEEEKALPGKPLTPYYPQRSIEEVLPAEDDPFNTSGISIEPGKTELKLLESELLSEDTGRAPDGLTRSVSEHEFEPRTTPAPSKNRRQSDFGPAAKSSEEVIESLITSNRRKALQRRQDSILDTAVEVTAAPLVPNVKPSTIEEEIELAYKDPFDTSHISKIGPGQAELKLIEDELSQVPEPQPIRLHPVIELVAKQQQQQQIAVDDDPNFDPRADERQTDILCSLDVQGVAPADKVLTPIQDTDSFEDVDPFDTRHVSIEPGKTELKLLESELISQ